MKQIFAVIAGISLSLAVTGCPIFFGLALIMTLATVDYIYNY